MKYISHKISVNEETFLPHMVIVVSIPIEQLTDQQVLLSREAMVEELGEMFWDVLQESTKHKATNEIEATPVSAIKEMIQND